jgi:hypothetical protein
MNVYIVHTRNSIKGAFSSKEKAEEFRKGFIRMLELAGFMDTRVYIEKIEIDKA